MEAIRRRRGSRVGKSEILRLLFDPDAAYGHLGGTSSRMAASEVQAAPAPAPSVPTGKWPARPVGLEFQMMGSPNGLTSLAAYYHDLRLTRGYTQFADGNWIVASPKGDPIARIGETTPLMVTYDQDGDLQGAVVSTGGDVIAYLTFGGDGGVGFAMNVTIAGAEGDAVRGFMARLRERMSAPNDPPDEQVRVAFAFESADNQFLRHLDAPKWADIRGNYPEKVRGTLDTYMDEAWRPSAGGKILLLQGSPGTGKAQPLGARILTPSGWTTIGELQVGDAVVGSDGAAHTVTGVFPQGIKPVYRVTFTDGAATETCDEHLWLTRRSRRAPWEILPLRTIKEHQLRGGIRNKRYEIQLVAPVELPAKPVPLDPYLLGVLLGDGGMTGGAVVLSTADDEIRRSVAQLTGPYGLELRRQGRYEWGIRGPQGPGQNHVITALRQLGLFGLSSHEKFIPDDYKWNDVATRLAVLQGLMDTDGTISRPRKFARDRRTLGGIPSYTTSSERLADDVVFLIRSLGGTVTKSRQVKKYTYKGVQKTGRPSYRLHICWPQGLTPPFRLERKRARYGPRAPRGIPDRKFRSIEHVGERETRCIAVDAPDRQYVTDDFILTHNTYSLRALLQQWRTWCDAAYITDPEVFFNKSPYLMGILLGGEDDRHQYVPPGAPVPEPRWKLVILEDAGELMARDAKMRTGQALSRLLNVTDGLIGQGLRVILLITTNEELGDLHDAVSRPGRAAAVVRFDRFSPDEARAWLAEHGMTDAPAISEPKTLAELYAILDGRRPTNIEKRAVGFTAR